jgi:hypothetical protein
MGAAAEAHGADGFEISLGRGCGLKRLLFAWFLLCAFRVGWGGATLPLGRWGAGGGGTMMMSGVALVAALRLGRVRDMC